MLAPMSLLCGPIWPICIEMHAAVVNHPGGRVVLIEFAVIAPRLAVDVDRGVVTRDIELRI